MFKLGFYIYFVFDLICLPPLPKRRTSVTNLLPLRKSETYSQPCCDIKIINLTSFRRFTDLRPDICLTVDMLFYYVVRFIYIYIY